MNELRGAVAALVLFALPFVAGVALGRFAGRGRWLARLLFIAALAIALVIGHLLTDRNRAGYRVLQVMVEVPFAVGALVAVAAGTIAGFMLGVRSRRGASRL